ncbi:diguanylate cyclase [Mitsuaria sp. WAJ17]|uniref:GGDEF domain-containing protein n=1 Tax=Mitsuaria sp. WAJ17 TaxID=2761452 RepID=UPI001602E2DD|nr:GGDEF domain-containing protein [Mitsuaria sp. WAJ17]MBB2486093.1 diguanylate cyclase [Mitsuaria sp. WAJ17]
MTARDGIPAEQRRLRALRRKIAEAEATLLALQASIDAARGNAGREVIRGMAAENQRLTAANLVAHQATATAYAALEKAVHASRTDPLTGLLNRLALWDRLEHDLNLARRNGSMLVVCFVDVDNFKQVNDTLGHAVGDQLLQGIARTLVGTVRASDTVCRLGGDEFVVFAPISTREDGIQLAAKITQAVSRLRMPASCELAASVSVGVSSYPHDGNTVGALLGKADEAMYRVKKARPDAASLD